MAIEIKKNALKAKDSDGNWSDVGAVASNDTYALRSKYSDTSISVGRKANTVIGEGSAAIGTDVVAPHDNEASFGKYNESNDNTLFSVGDGTADDTRHNAFEITTDGAKLHDKEIATMDDIPTSLPANGGNADTVDGLHADEIANNPNILINPDFKINQRGQSSYSGAVYGVDRWTGIYGGELVEVTDYGISATFENNQGIRQIIENTNQYKGKQLTISACYNLKKGSYGDSSYVNFSLAYGDLTPIISFNSNEVHDEFVVKSATCIVPSDIFNLSFHITANGVVGIKWVKVEIGSVATPFSPPNITTERIKCQRYYYRFTRGRKPFASGYAVNTSTANIFIPMTQMRIDTPDVAFSNIVLMGHGHTSIDTSVPVNKIINAAMTPNGISLQMTGSGLTSEQMYMTTILDGGYLAFDAELY